jgi:hypothetical protein
LTWGYTVVLAQRSANDQALLSRTPYQSMEAAAIAAAAAAAEAAAAVAAAAV